VSFQALSADEIAAGVLAAHPPFNRIILSGILIYLNDEQVANLLRRLSTMCAPSAVVYIREPMGCDQRLTLDGHWSSELSAEYNAIYRTEAELSGMLVDAFSASGFEVPPFEKLYGDDRLNNRSDTQQQFVLVRKSK
jgi:O-methyltransferase involved in polyketide biosynthesis